MQVLFGDKGFDYGRFGLVAIGVGMGLYLCGATLNQAALAVGDAARRPDAGSHRPPPTWCSC